MSRSLKNTAILLACVLAGCSPQADVDGDGELIVEALDTTEQAAGYYGHGEPASAEQIAGWDIDIRPDGLGLPPGGATPEDGEMLYEDKCAICHGSFGEGVGRYPVLAGGEGTLTEARPEKTVGSFWPYASTLWDYIHRAMPFAEPQSLSDDEVYAITAYVLYLNDLIDYEFEVTQANLSSIEMPNQDGFYVDDRPDVIAERCMSNCKDPNAVQITSEPELQTAVEEPTATTAAADSGDSAGRDVYGTACAVCHDSGVGNAPVLASAADWQSRLETGRAAMIDSVINGKGLMPAKGGQTQLSNEQITHAVDYMLAAVE